MQDTPFSPIELSLFASRLASICDEMGAVLRRSAFSPNIKDRLDFSCAIFDGGGQLVAQAAHIPVHLGSMAYAMVDIVSQCDWRDGDTVVVNDPYLGGTHLPDITVISPVFVDGQLLAFVANRAHHANVGASSPGSMPIAKTLEEEGIVLAPTRVERAGQLRHDVMQGLFASIDEGDFIAQISTNKVGCRRLQELVAARAEGRHWFAQAVTALNDYGERVATAQLSSIPDGRYSAIDWMDGDGINAGPVKIALTLDLSAAGVVADFSGTSEQVSGNINCPLSVTAAAVFYVFRCLMPAELPVCAGLFRPIRLRADAGSLVNARRPAAVAAGNVETSSRIVDVVIAALAQAIPDRVAAASQGTMNNLAMGSRGEAGPRWNYYETMGGGMGASARGPGLSALQTHMTNTLNTPVESLELHYPLRLTRYQLRRGSGGKGIHAGGQGMLREFEFLAPAEATLLTERREFRPRGLAGGGDGLAGENRLNGQLLPAKCQLSLKAGDHLLIASPGGGGWGKT